MEVGLDPRRMRQTRLGTDAGRAMASRRSTLSNWVGQACWWLAVV
jgi:hypothetical protein